MPINDVNQIYELRKDASKRVISAIDACGYEYAKLADYLRMPQTAISHLKSNKRPMGVPCGSVEALSRVCNFGSVNEMLFGNQVKMDVPARLDLFLKLCDGLAAPQKKELKKKLTDATKIPLVRDAAAQNSLIYLRLTDYASENGLQLNELFANCLETIALNRLKNLHGDKNRICIPTIYRLCLILGICPDYLLCSDYTSVLSLPTEQRKIASIFLQCNRQCQDDMLAWLAVRGLFKRPKKALKYRR